MATEIGIDRPRSLTARASPVACDNLVRDRRINLGVPAKPVFYLFSLNTEKFGEPQEERLLLRDETAISQGYFDKPIEDHQARRPPHLVMEDLPSGLNVQLFRHRMLQERVHTLRFDWIL